MSPATPNDCQELQSCVEPKLIEQNENKLNSPLESKASRTDGPPEGWNSLDFLAKNRAQITEDLEQVCTCPFDERSMYSLSQRSLEMCTENLGSETGSVIYSSIDEFTARRTDKQSFLETKHPKTREFRKKMEQRICFPPPLSSIRGRDGVLMYSHREGGRLVIKAFSSPNSCGMYFEAIRENGKLRLCLQMNEYRDWVDIENQEEENGYEPEKSRDQSEDRGKFGCEEWCRGSRSRCNGGGKRLASLPYYVAIS